VPRGEGSGVAPIPRWQENLGGGRVHIPNLVLFAHGKGRERRKGGLILIGKKKKGRLHLLQMYKTWSEKWRISSPYLGDKEKKEEAAIPLRNGKGKQQPIAHCCDQMG